MDHAWRTTQILVVVAIAVGCDPAPRRRAGDDPRPEPTAPAAPRIETVSFRSGALGVDKRALVYLPAGYGASRQRYPVVYVLHGYGGSADEWRTVVPAAAREAGLEALVVMVDGDDSFYVDGATAVDYDACLARSRPDDCVRHPRYERYVTEDVIGAIDRRFRTIPGRAARALSGFSMGGYGALVLAMRHPDLFSVSISHAGVTSLRVNGPADVAGWGREHEIRIPGIGDQVRGIFGPDPARWRAHDPVALAGTLSPGRLAILLDCGTEDEFGFADLARDLHRALEDRGIAHELTLVPGGRHDGQYLRDRFDDGLRFAGEKLEAAR